MTKFLSNIELVLFFKFFVKFHHDTPNIVKELEAKKHFCTLGAGADNSNGVNLEHHRKLLSL